MSDVDLHRFYHDYIDALNTRRLSTMDAFIHDDVLRNGRPSTRREAVADLAALIEAVPDFRWRIVDLAVDGGTIATRLIDNGTPTGRWMGLEATGAAVEYMELAFYKVRDGRFSEMNFAMDVLAIQRQLAPGASTVAPSR